jgi:hypothetical protein
MDLLGIAETDLIEDVELGVVATLLGETHESGTILFIRRTTARAGASRLTSGSLVTN